MFQVYHRVRSAQSAAYTTNPCHFLHLRFAACTGKSVRLLTLVFHFLDFRARLYHQIGGRATVAAPFLRRRGVAGRAAYTMELGACEVAAPFLRHRGVAGNAAYTVELGACELAAPFLRHRGIAGSAVYTPSSWERARWQRPFLGTAALQEVRRILWNWGRVKAAPSF